LKTNAHSKKQSFVLNSTNVKNNYTSEQPSSIAEELEKFSGNIRVDDYKNKIENQSNYLS